MARATIRYTVTGDGSFDFYSGWQLGSNDTVVELAGGGYDIMYVAAWSATLPDNVEVLVAVEFSGDFVMAPGGADLRRHLVGNSAANVIDTSTLNYNDAGYADGFLLDGGAGADVMIGGSADDTYVVDNVNDLVLEVYGSGFADQDKVITALEYVLSTDIENLTLIGSAAVSGTGNARNNILDGSANSAANVLKGLAGSDRYLLGAGDTIVEAAGEGIDRAVITEGGVQTYSLAAFDNVEDLELTLAVGASSPWATRSTTGLSATPGTTPSMAALVTTGSTTARRPARSGNDILLGGDGNRSPDYSRRVRHSRRRRR